MRTRKEYIAGLSESEHEMIVSKFLEVNMYSSTHDEKGYPLEQEVDDDYSSKSWPYFAGKKIMIRFCPSFAKVGRLLLKQALLNIHFSSCCVWFGSDLETFWANFSPVCRCRCHSLERGSSRCYFSPNLLGRRRSRQTLWWDHQATRLYDAQIRR